MDEEQGLGGWKFTEGRKCGQADSSKRPIDERNMVKMTKDPFVMCAHQFRARPGCRPVSLSQYQGLYNWGQFRDLGPLWGWFRLKFCLSPTLHGPNSGRLWIHFRFTGINIFCSFFNPLGNTPNLTNLNAIHFCMYDKPRQGIKKQRPHFADKGPYNQSYGFSSSHVLMWELDNKEGWGPKNWCFRIVMLEKTFESPLDSKEIKPVNPKGNQPWIFTGKTDAETKTLILGGYLIWRTNSLEKTLIPGKTEGKSRREQRMRWLDGITDSTWIWANCAR